MVVPVLFYFDIRLSGYIGVVRKTFRLRTFFLLQPLMPPPYFRNIIMTSGINRATILRRV